MSQAPRIFAMVAALSVGAACSDNPAGVAEPPGTVLLRLTTPHADDGALVFEVSGPPIDSATAASGSLRLFTRRAGGSTLVGIVAGAVAAGPIVTLHVRSGASAATPGYAASDATRNATIERYFEAIDLLVDRGYTVVRLGNASMPRLARAGVVDLAHRPDPDGVLTLFAIQRSAFLVGCESGPAKAS